ncbi:MAG: hypothetical protein AABZ74_17545 [Cyanobacteriota bacterium]
MNKKTIFKNILKLSLFSLLISQSACVVANNCYKLGYSQKIDATFFNEKDSKGYFIYSYLDKKDSKSYFLYKIDVNGSSEKIIDLGSKSYDAKNQNSNNLDYKFTILSNDKILLQENISSDKSAWKQTINSGSWQPLELSSSYYLVDLKSKSLIYKKDSLSQSSIFDSENKNIFNMTSKGINVFNIENGFYYNNTIENNEKESYLSAKWVNSNTLFVIKTDGLGYNSKFKTAFIYQLKDNNLTKISEYNINETEQNIFQNMEPKSYTNNTLEFESNVREISHLPKISKNSYKLDFSNNLVTLLKSDLPDEIIEINKSKILLKASQKMYLEYIEPNSIVTSKKPIFDYLKELPKGFYSEELLCGDYKTM